MENGQKGDLLPDVAPYKFSSGPFQALSFFAYWLANEQNPTEDVRPSGAISKKEPKSLNQFVEDHLVKTKLIGKTSEKQTSTLLGHWRLSVCFSS